MVELTNEVIPVTIEDELKQSYLDYAMSVIVGRALPDVRDGLKPVHRRVLFAMHELGNDWNKAYKKSARVVGDVIGKYHPHGDTAVYDTIVRMAQPFSLRYMLVDGQGNFGSVDGDSPAAMRYTEVRMSKIAHALLADLEKDTVSFAPNYDETEFAPTVLPSRIPNLLINGSTGIAVGMATNIPPHNLDEVVNACMALMDDASLSIDDLMTHIPGPDFPTAAIINGRAGIIEAYRTGRGRIYVRARLGVETDEKSNKQSIIIHELPYQVNKARLIEKMAEMVRDKRLEGITGLRDESDKDGMRVVIELRRGEVAEVVQNNLYKHTQMQTVFGINMVALVNGEPRTLNLKEILVCFIKHRQEVVTRRTLFELRKARTRAHLLEGLAVALANIDNVILIIKSSPSPQEAKARLLDECWQPGIVRSLLDSTGSDACRPDELDDCYGLNDSGYKLSPQQVQAILDLKLHRLTALEQNKIRDEFSIILERIKEFLEILASPARLMQVIKDELIEIKTQFSDERRTEITASQADLTVADLIPQEDVVITLSNQGYVKYQPLSVYQSQRRGGRGKSATNMKEEDFIEKLIITNTHDTLLCFSTTGKVYWLRAFELPTAVNRSARGKPIVNILPLAADERINAMLPLQSFDEDRFVFMATQKGTVKKVSLEQFSRPRANGIIAIDLDEGDSLVGVNLTEGDQEAMLFSDAGKVVRFNESLVRCMGRTARGVRGIRLPESQKVIALTIVEPECTILTATENGFGKRTDITEYRASSRGVQGVISIQVNERNGDVVRAIQVQETDEVMLISNRGTLVRLRVRDISVIGRNTQGVKLINLAEDEHLVGMQRIEEMEETDETDDEENELKDDNSNDETNNTVQETDKPNQSDDESQQSDD